jgi:hypothetical protein
MPYAVAILIALAATIPFLNKAYHIDDVLYFSVAQQIIQTPLTPYGDREKSMVMWDAEDGRPASLFDTDYNPPLWKYILAATIKWWGQEEWKPHLVVAIVVVFAALGLYLVSRLITGWPLWCVAMIVLAPFYMPGQNCMLEPMVLCLTAWGTYFQFRSWETGRIGPALFAGTLLGLAVLTKYSTGVLLPLFFVGCFLFQGPVRENRKGLLFARLADLPPSLVFVVPAAALIALWCIHNVIYYGQPHLTSHGVMFKPEEWFGKTLTVLRTMGSVSFVGPVWWVLLWKRGIIGRQLLALIALVSAFSAFIDVWQIGRAYGNAQLFIITVQAFMFTFVGTATILSIFVFSWIDFRLDTRLWWSASTDRFLELWIAAFLAFNVMCTPFNAVRHMLLCFVAMTWLTARRMPLDWSRLASVILGCSVVLGYLLAAGDYEIANTYRDIAQNYIRRDVAAGRKVWITGNWGFLHYGMKEGAHPLFIGTEDFGLGRPWVGDRIYHPVLLNWRTINPVGKEWIEHLQPEGFVPLRTIAPGAHYYGMLTFVLPWEFLLVPPNEESGRSGYEFPPIDHIQIFDVREPQRTRSPWQ